MGHPNVGKSTLVNALTGQKIAAVSPRPQTTRRRQMGILTLENDQIIFLDTPGVHRPRHKLGESMVKEATEALEECDLALLMVDASLEPQDEDRQLMGIWKSIKRRPPAILLLNKSDLLADDQLGGRVEAYKDLLAPLKEPLGAVLVLPVSARRGDNLQTLVEEVVERLPEGSPFFPEDQVTDLHERDIAADLIREATLVYLRDEVPHGIIVSIDDYQERDERGAYIAATLFVERESHKPIVIGEGGAMLKKIGTAARQEIEAMSGRKVFLELRVKVSKNWRNDEKALRRFGFKP